jgi:phosphoribosylanthranilate isomerase
MMKNNDFLVKICGLTDPENIEDLVRLHPDFIGLIFYQKSPRLVNRFLLSAWFKSFGNARLGKVKKVGVFVNEEPETVIARCLDFDLHLIQLHGNEDIKYMNTLLSLLKVHHLEHIQLIKAFGVTDSFDFNAIAAFEIFIDYFLFDTKTEKKGGSGLKFPWSKLTEYKGNTPFLLSGGIGPDDYTDIQKLMHPKLAGIDVNSKFEISPGLKNVSSLQLFLHNLNNFRFNAKFK